MMRTLYLFATLTALSGPAVGQQAMEDIRKDLQYLAADERQGRGVGTTGLDTAAAYLARRFEEIGLEPAGTDGYLQPFELNPTAAAVSHAGIGAVPVSNVVGRIPGRGALADEYVVVGAHYDHLGLGGFGSLEPDSTGIVHNGADDNASGTVALIEIARQLRSRDSDNLRSILIVAFTAEELGLIGSAHFARGLAQDDPVYAMLNLDMVGRMVEDRLAVFGAETAEEFPAMLDSINVAYDLTLNAAGDGFGRSDHQSFFEQGIPVVHFFTGTHENYHRTSDDAEFINIEGIAQVASLAADLAWHLAQRQGDLTFVDAAPPQLTVAAEGERPYLGTIPDMTDNPGGVRLSGVTAGSPAEAAGLQKGDILVGLDEFEITDLFKMTDALNSRSPGDTVTLRVRRDGGVIELTAILGRRGG